MTTPDMFPEAARTPVPAGETDSWFTPLGLWLDWHQEFDFTIDVAGHEQAPVSKAIGRMYAIEDDGLTHSWKDERVWCNPPYSDIGPWVRKADFEARSRCPLIAMLLPATKTEQPWWQEFVEHYRDGRRPTWLNGVTTTLETRFLQRRFKFGFPGDPEGKTGHGATFGCVLLVWRRA